MNTPNDELIRRIRASYEALSIPESYIYSEKQDHRSFLAMLTSIESQIPSMHCDVVATSFEANDPDLRAFPRPLSWRWSSAERALRAFGAEGVLMRVPLFWQIEPALFAAGQSAGAAIFVNDQGNMPVGAAAIRTAHMDTVVTDSPDALIFSSYLSEAKTQFPASWIIVHLPLLDVWAVPAPAREIKTHLAQEVHVFPGVPFLEQCEFLYAKKESVFHACDSFVVETGQECTYLTSAQHGPLPLLRYELNLSLTELGTCECGKRLLVRGK